MTNVIRFHPRERVDLRDVCPGAEDAGALDELVMLLYHSRQDARALARVADLAGRLGLAQLDRVACQLAGIPVQDIAARAAVSARLVRVGEATILAMWDRQDRSL